MDYKEFVERRAKQYNLSVEMTERVGRVFWTPGDPLAKVIQDDLATKGGGNSLADWLGYAQRHDLSEWLEKGEGQDDTQELPPPPSESQ